MKVVKAAVSGPKIRIMIEGPEDAVARLIGAPAIARALSDESLETGAPASLAEALEHVWDWFSLHAQQRLQAVNFFLIAAAFLSTAYVTALRFEHHAAAIGIGFVGGFIALVFEELETRIRELLHASEHALKLLENRMAEAFDVEELRLAESVETPRRRTTAYSFTIGMLHLLTGFAFLAGADYAAYLAQG